MKIELTDLQIREIITLLEKAWVDTGRAFFAGLSDNLVRQHENLTAKDNKVNYSYAIIKDNYKELAKESTFLDNDYKATKFALIEKQMFKDGSEGINRIIYSNDLHDLQSKATNYVSWYNYPMNLTKDMQQNIRTIN